MKFKAKITKSGRFYAIEIPAFDLHTQAESKGTINAMILDVLESIFDRKLKIKVDRPEKKSDKVETRSFHVDPISEMISTILKRQRIRSGLTIEQVSKSLGSDSKNAYAAYEQGKREPSLSKFSELLRAVSKDNGVDLSIE